MWPQPAQKLRFLVSIFWIISMIWTFTFMSFCLFIGDFDFDNPTASMASGFTNELALHVCEEMGVKCDFVLTDYECRVSARTCVPVFEKMSLSCLSYHACWYCFCFMLQISACYARYVPRLSNVGLYNKETETRKRFTNYVQVDKLSSNILAEFAGKLLVYVVFLNFK